jgi:hypothetical protein
VGRAPWRSPDEQKRPARLPSRPQRSFRSFHSFRHVEYDDPFPTVR